MVAVLGHSCSWSANYHRIRAVGKPLDAMSASHSCIREGCIAYLVQARQDDTLHMHFYGTVEAQVTSLQATKGDAPIPCFVKNKCHEAIVQLARKLWRQVIAAVLARLRWCGGSKASAQEVACDGICTSHDCLQPSLRFSDRKVSRIQNGYVTRLCRLRQVLYVGA